MIKIEAYEASDGAQFFTEAECLAHEKTYRFRDWYKERELESSHWRNVELWIVENADYIRGFLPAIEEKPELDIKVLRSESRWSNLENDTIVTIATVQKWLAGELK